jgi:hypothetical protein
MNSQPVENSVTDIWSYGRATFREATSRDLGASYRMNRRELDDTFGIHSFSLQGRASLNYEQAISGYIQVIVIS